MTLDNSLPVVILAAGDSKRFGGLKHLEVVAGETLVGRQARLWHEKGAGVTVIVPPESVELYRGSGLTRATVVPRSAPAETNGVKYREALNVADDGPVVITFGDVFYTSRAIEAIHAGCEGEAIRLFCRFGPSAYTGKPYGEPFALFLPGAQRSRFTDALEWVVVEYAEGRIWRDGLWEVAKRLEGVPPERFGEHLPLSMFVEIDDLTDDIDFPEDLDRLRAVVPSTMDEAIDELSSVMGLARRMMMSPMGAVPEPDLHAAFASAVTAGAPSIPPLQVGQSAKLWARWIVAKAGRGVRRVSSALERRLRVGST
jgi:CTP:molybdopterin cytidylyltransferase MocA